MWKTCCCCLALLRQKIARKKVRNACEECGSNANRSQDGCCSICLQPHNVSRDTLQSHCSTNTSTHHLLRAKRDPCLAGTATLWLSVKARRLKGSFVPWRPLDIKQRGRGHGMSRAKQNQQPGGRTTAIQAVVLEGRMMRIFAVQFPRCDPATSGATGMTALSCRMTATGASTERVERHALQWFMLPSILTTPTLRGSPRSE